MINGILGKLLEEGAFTGCAAGLATSEGVAEECILGLRERIPYEKPMTHDTLFDMASVSKILGPAMIALVLHNRHELGFSLRIGSVIPDSGSYSEATILDLLRHSAGFLPELPLWKEAEDPDDMFRRILSSPMQYRPGESAIYSCLGYILLGHILEMITGETLERLASELVWKPIGMDATTYHPSPERAFAATERKAPDTDECWCGIVHDENARFLFPHESGNAGVFSTLQNMLSFSVFILRELREPSFFTPEEMRMLSSDLTPFAPISRSVGFMVNQRGYSQNAGTEAGSDSFGHTGFTGTSIWFSPELDAAAVLLANRIHPSRDNMILRQRLGAFHDAAFSEIRSMR